MQRRKKSISSPCALYSLSWLFSSFFRLTVDSVIHFGPWVFFFLLTTNYAAMCYTHCGSSLCTCKVLHTQFVVWCLVWFLVVSVVVVGLLFWFLVLCLFVLVFVIFVCLFFCFVNNIPHLETATDLLNLL